MQKLLYLFFLLSLIACEKRSDDLLTEKPVLKKAELHIHASESYTQPWLDSVNASIYIAITKSNKATTASQVIWDTTFASRPLKQYPLLPQKFLIEKRIPVFEPTERVEVAYTIWYDYNQITTEWGNAVVADESFTFVDVKL